MFFVISNNFWVVNSLLLFSFTLLFLGFLLLNYSPRNSEAIVFLEVVFVMDITSNEKVWMRRLQLIKESIVDYRQLGDIQEHELSAFLNEMTNAEITDSITLNQL